MGPQTQSEVVRVRITREEIDRLDVVARRLSVSRSWLIRAGIRAVVSDPRLVWSGMDVEPPAADDLRAKAQPESTSPPRRRRRKR